MEQEACCERPHHPKVGDRVSVIRTRHGWFDGALQATVTGVHHSLSGGISYTIAGDDGCEHFCPKRNDLALLRD